MSDVFTASARTPEWLNFLKDPSHRKTTVEKLDRRDSERWEEEVASHQVCPDALDRRWNRQPSVYEHNRLAIPSNSYVNASLLVHPKLGVEDYDALPHQTWIAAEAPRPSIVKPNGDRYSYDTIHPFLSTLLSPVTTVSSAAAQPSYPPVHVILQLTGTKLATRQGVQVADCSPYFPAQPGEGHEMRFENSLKRSVPAIIVRLVSQDPESQVRRVGWRISVLELSYENQPESTRQVTHMNMKSWPDGSVPDAHSHWGPPEKRLLDFITKAKDLNDRLSSAQAALSPVMTHCSVGRGRTGTLIASAMLIEVADFARHVDLHEKVTTSQRMDGDPLPEFDVKNHGKEFPTIDVVGLFWDSLRAQRRLMLEERQLGLVLACATRYSAQASKPAVIDQPATDQYYRAGDEQPISKVFGDTYVKLSKRDHKTFHPDQPQGIHNCRFCHLVLINGNDHPLASTHAYDPSCDLCKAVHSSEVLYEDEHFAVIEDIAPASPLHLLCIPKRHVHSPVSFTETGEDLHEHEKDTLEYYDALVSFARKSFAEEAKRRGYQFGPSTVLTGLHVSPTTSVDHFHLQILLVLTPSLVRKLENEAKSSGSRTEKLRKMKKKYHTKFVPSLIHRGVGAAPDESKILPSDPSSLLVLRGFAFFVLAARFRAIIEHSLLRVELVGHNVFEKEEERWTRREIGLVEYPIQ